MTATDTYSTKGADPPRPPTTYPVTSPERAVNRLLPLLADRDREACAVLYLDTKHNVIDAEVLTIGSLDRTLMDPRTIYRAALVNNAAAIIVGHNHPSGDPKPSPNDLAVTHRLIEAGDLIGIDLLDHVVIGSKDHWASVAQQLV